MFPHPLTEILLLIIGFGEYWSLTRFSSQVAFIFTTQFLLLPLYGLLIALHIQRDESLRVFEVNLVGDWYSYLLARLLVTGAGLMPLVAVSYVAMLVAHQPLLAAFIALWAVCFLSIASLSSLARSLGVFIVVLITYAMLLPVALASLYQEYSAANGSPPPTLDYLTYYTSPLMAHYYGVGGLMVVSGLSGFLVALIVSLIVTLVYFLVGRRMELNP